MNQLATCVLIVNKNILDFLAVSLKTDHTDFNLPGGKVEKGETFEIALKREIKEELNIEINIKNKLGEENYQDDKINVKLHYFICSHAKGEIILSEHEDSAWVTKNEFKNYNFAEGDSDIINLL